MLSSGPASSMTVNCANIADDVVMRKDDPFGSPELPLVNSQYGFYVSAFPRQTDPVG